MPDDEMSSLVREAAERFELDVTAEQARELATAVDDLETRFETFDSTHDRTTVATDVRRGDDPYNAFIHRCQLETDDGPLSDIEVAVKDNIAVAGVPVTCGSDALKYTPDRSATVVQRLTEAGATLVGTTNMDEFAYFVTGETSMYGRTANPRVDGCVPGGSSSGSAAAVAGGLVDAALGTDTGGSIRIPSSFTGVVGIKPTFGSVSRAGFIDLAPSLDHIGPMASSVRDAARLLDSIYGPDARDFTTYGVPPDLDCESAVSAGVNGLRLALLEEPLARTADGVAEQVRETAAALKQMGGTVERVSFPLIEIAREVLVPIIGREFIGLLGDGGFTTALGFRDSEAWRGVIDSTESSESVGENVHEQILVNEALRRNSGNRHYVAAQSARARIVLGIQELLSSYDALLTPTTAMTAPEFGTVTDLDDLVDIHANTCPFNLSGHPAASVPCGSVAGKPVGFQTVSDWHDESTVVRVAGAVERLA